jgi:hypothetical protein
MTPRTPPASSRTNYEVETFVDFECEFYERVGGGRSGEYVGQRGSISAHSPYSARQTRIECLLHRSGAYCTDRVLIAPIRRGRAPLRPVNPYHGLPPPAKPRAPAATVAGPASAPIWPTYRGVRRPEDLGKQVSTVAAIVGRRRRQGGRRSGRRPTGIATRRRGATPTGCGDPRAGFKVPTSLETADSPHHRASE